MSRVSCIAFLTDFGLKDPYVASMKAAALKQNSEIICLDLTHEIETQNIEEAAWVLKAWYRDQIEGTVFCCVVDPGVGTARRAVAFSDGTYFFVGPDNGLFSLIEVEESEIIYELSDTPTSQTFHGRDLFSPVSAKIAAGVPLKEIGSPSDRPLVQLDLPRPHFENGQWRTQIVRVDYFGNLISNLHIHQCKGKSALKGVETECEKLNIVSTYAEADEKAVALWGSSGYLEIAIKNGSAADRMGWGLGQQFLAY